MQLRPVSIQKSAKPGLKGYLPKPSLARLALLWLPTSLAVLAVVLPVAYLVIRALGVSRGGLDMLLRLRTLEILGNTLALAMSVTFACAVLALAFAWLTVRTELPWRRLWAVTSVLPLVIPSYVGAYLFVAALGPRGLFQQVLETLFGVERLPEIYGFPGAFLALTLLSYPYALLPIRAALQHMDPALEESSRSLGHGSWSSFWRVTLPHLRPALAAGGLLVGLYTLRDFGAVSIMRYTTFTRAIYVQYQSAFDRSTAALLSLVLVGLTLWVVYLEHRTRSHGRYHGGGSARKPLPRIPLGAWRWPALAFCASIVGAALVLPAGVLAYWLIRGLLGGQGLLSLWAATRNSLIASASGAVATVVAALPLVVLSVRYPGRWSRLVERLAHLGFALPGIVVALSLVFFGARFAPFVYQTLPMLILGYLILFLPQAFGSIRTSLLQVHPSLEEAARSLGHHPMAVFRRVTLPLVRPGLLASAALVFLTTMKELQATLLLGPFGFKTLATEVWSAVSEAFFARAAAPALLLILTSSIPMAYFVLREHKETP